jgi:archaemetzincin
MIHFVRQSLKVLLPFLLLTACSDNNHNYDCIDKIKALDKKMPPLRAGDWLGSHHEDGQTFKQYTDCKPVRLTAEQNIIYLMPVGEFAALEDTLIQHTADYLSIYFELKVAVLPAISDNVIPKKNRRINGDTNEEQLMTTYILDSLVLPKKPSDGIVAMAITSKDLYPSEAWNFVFGQSYIYKRAAVSSFDRYKKGKLNPENYAKVLERLIKTASHEIGHAFSVRHCTHAVCVMNGSNNMEEADSRPNALCSVCLRKLYWNLGFEVAERNEKLQNFFINHGLFEDYKNMQNIRIKTGSTHH